MLVDGMIQERTVNIIVGDSGIGKSPFLQQLALCVATGQPFLGMLTRQANVLCVDFENSATEFNNTLDQLTKFLDISPDAELPHFGVLTYPESKPVIESEIRTFKPELVIIDALRGFDHKAEKDAEACMACLDWLHKKAEKYQTAFLVLHHIRKPDEKEPPPKLSALSQPVIAWLNQASGSRALINQTEARFAIEEYTQGEASLIMRGHLKLTGETPPIYIERVYDPDEPKPLGYSRIYSPTLLSQSDRERISHLPESFTWAEAESSLGIKRGKNLVRLVANACAAGIYEKTGIGRHIRYLRIRGN
jgi:hypothetical protein